MVVNAAPRWSVFLCSCWCQEQDLLSTGIGLDVIFFNKPRGKPEDTRPTPTQSDAPGHLLLKSCASTDETATSHVRSAHTAAAAGAAFTTHARSFPSRLLLAARRTLSAG